MPDYEYTGLLPPTWDLLRGDTSRWPDHFFFRDLIQRYGQLVLEVQLRASQTGRHAFYGGGATSRAGDDVMPVPPAAAIHPWGAARVGANTALTT
ncbi:MAG TPA: hypothetical protein VLA19_23190 [Herpetosiphonaceae bacterium]|nr:hypothetical protein [Herpetosiphonaceae bacterium]